MVIPLILKLRILPLGDLILLILKLELAGLVTAALLELMDCLDGEAVKPAFYLRPGLTQARFLEELDMLFRDIFYLFNM